MWQTVSTTVWYKYVILIHKLWPQHTNADQLPQNVFVWVPHCPSCGFEWPTVTDMHSTSKEHFSEGTSPIPKLETQHTFILLTERKNRQHTNFSPCPNTDVWNYRVTNYQCYCFVLASYGTPAEVWYCWFKWMPVIAIRFILQSHNLQFPVQQTCNFQVPPKINYTNTTPSLFTLQIYSIHRTPEIIFTNGILRNQLSYKHEITTLHNSIANFQSTM
jgi:hypothetical protein